MFTTLGLLLFFFLLLLPSVLKLLSLVLLCPLHESFKSQESDKHQSISSSPAVFVANQNPNLCHSWTPCRLIGWFVWDRHQSCLQSCPFPHNHTHILLVFLSESREVLHAVIRGNCSVDLFIFIDPQHVMICVLYSISNRIKTFVATRIMFIYRSVEHVLFHLHL